MDPLGSCRTSFSGSVKVHQPRFLQVEFQPEPAQAFGKHFQHSLRILLIVKQQQKSSSPGEFHPQALTEPYVNVSAHTALIAQSPV